MTQFDPASFLDATLTEPTTRRNPIPAGQVLVGTIGEPKSRTWQGKKDPTQSGVAVDVPITFDLEAYPAIKEKVFGPEHTGSAKVTLVDGVMLDLTESGSMDNSPGKNGKVRKYREALNLNKPGDTFSWRQLQGRQIGAKISWREYEGDMYDQIDSVVKA